MSDEEKKAIDELKEEINKPVEVPEDKFDTFILYNIESAKIILNLIEKQSKEIEELKEEYNTKLLSNAGIYQLGFKDGKKSVEDKIKAKIEEKRKVLTDTNVIIIDVLQSLLEKE